MKIEEPQLKIQFSDREKQIIEALSLGYSTNEIASQLRISKHTVDTHRKNMLRKLNARNVAHLVRNSINLGLLKNTDQDVNKEAPP